MPSFEKVLLFVVAVAGMVAIIPLSVWAGSGSRRAAWEATKRYLLIMGIIFGGGFLLAGIILLASLGGS